MDNQPLNRAERRRRARAEQKVNRRLNHPKHGYDPEAVLLQLRDQASQVGIAGLMLLSDEDWDMLPDGSVEFARSVFAPDFSVNGDMAQLVLLVATVCQLWADSESDSDEVEASMLQGCGLSVTIDDNGPAIGINDAAVFADASMLVANRVALVGESSTHRGV